MTRVTPEMIERLYRLRLSLRSCPYNREQLQADALEALLADWEEWKVITELQKAAENIDAKIEAIDKSKRVSAETMRMEFDV